MTIDDLLSQPLTSVSDDGFSERVMGCLRARQLRRLAVEWLGIAACAGLAMLVLPLHAIGAQLGLIIPEIAGSAALSFAAAIVVLSLMLESQFARL